MNSVADRIKEGLKGLQAERLELEDESERHRGHEGAKGGGGHYRLLVVSREFSGLSTMERHRMVYRMLSELMKKEIHALSLKAYTPDEYHALQ